MDAGLSPVREARARHRHELRMLTYVTLDQANGGIIRNLTHEGIAVQLVAAVRPRQQMRVRFELRHPRLRVEARGEVVWATFSGQCGIRFLDLSPRAARQIDEWIFGNLLEGIPLSFASNLPISKHPAWDERLRPDQRARLEAGVEIEEDGLMVSDAAVKVIELPTRQDLDRMREPECSSLQADAEEIPALDWLSQPLSSHGLAWTVNVLAVVAALLLFMVIFLSVTRELPQWPYAFAGGATVLVAALYWGFFKLLGGSSPGARLARMAGYDLEEEEEIAARFR